MRSSLGSGFNVPSPNTLEFLALPRPPAAPGSSRLPLAHCSLGCLQPASLPPAAAPSPGSPEPSVETCGILLNMHVDKGFLLSCFLREATYCRH